MGGWMPALLRRGLGKLFTIALGNLIENALKYSEDDVIIEIEDNAGGIEIDNLYTLFEPYFSTKKQRNGTGLGLYVAKTVIEHQIHGELDVRYGQEGLCFIIKVPKSVSEDH